MFMFSFTVNLNNAEAGDIKPTHVFMHVGAQSDKPNIIYTNIKNGRWLGKIEMPFSLDVSKAFDIVFKASSTSTQVHCIYPPLNLKILLIKIDNK